MSGRGRMGGTSPLKVMCTSNESMRVQCGDSSIQVHLPPLQDTPPPTAYLSRLSSIGVLHACFCTCSKTNNITEVYWGSGQGMGGGQRQSKVGGLCSYLSGGFRVLCCVVLCCVVLSKVSAVRVRAGCWADGLHTHTGDDL